MKPKIAANTNPPAHPTARQLAILRELCDLPTAPYCEQHIIAWLLAWAATKGEAIRVRRDGAGNVYIDYRAGPKGGPPLVLEAHMDHPGFVARAMRGSRREGTRARNSGRREQAGNMVIDAEFRGTVRPSHFAGASVRFWIEEETAPGNRVAGKEKISTASGPPTGLYRPTGRWAPAKVLKVKTIPRSRYLRVTLSTAQRVPPGSLGMWDLPDAALLGDLFAARGCDDVAGVAVIVCVLEALIAGKVAANVTALCSRAEEVGFAGVLAACQHGWLPERWPVIGIETSKAFSTAPQGAGPIIRVGDKTGTFSAGLTHFLSQTAGHLSDDDASFVYQRKLMDGGTCNSTAFLAWDFDSGAVCLALGNYHNMTVKGEAGWHATGGGRRVAAAGPGIASETIHLADFAGLVRLLVESARRIGTYRRGLKAVRERLTTMHRNEQTRVYGVPGVL